MQVDEIFNFDNSDTVICGSIDATDLFIQKGQYELLCAGEKIGTVAIEGERGGGRRQNTRSITLKPPLPANLQTLKNRRVLFNPVEN